MRASDRACGRLRHSSPTPKIRTAQPRPGDSCEAARRGSARWRGTASGNACPPRAQGPGGTERVSPRASQDGRHRSPMKLVDRACRRLASLDADLGAGDLERANAIGLPIDADADRVEALRELGLGRSQSSCGPEIAFRRAQRGDDLAQPLARRTLLRSESQERAADTAASAWSPGRTAATYAERPNDLTDMRSLSRTGRRSSPQRVTIAAVRPDAVTNSMSAQPSP